MKVAIIAPGNSGIGSLCCMQLQCPGANAGTGTRIRVAKQTWTFKQG